MLFLISCSGPQIQSVPTITPTPGWSIERVCGYEHCGLYVDHLKGHGFELRIEAYNYFPNVEYLRIGLTFITPMNEKFSFNPSLSFVELPDSRRFVSRGFAFHAVPYERNVTGQIPLGTGDIHKGRSWDRFTLEFNCNPSVTDEFDLKIYGLQKNGSNVEIPMLHFSPLPVRR